MDRDCFLEAQEAMNSNNKEALLLLYNELRGQLNSKPRCSSYLLRSKLGNSLYRHIVAETYIPSSMKSQGKIYTAIRSQASGNCLYSSVSLLLVGDNSLTCKPSLGK
ncbi:uncharacterized protein LOC124458264 isoform X1 [Xenia sp. Carnegie-2017]|uniref:uncharacterized protein LOC124445767 n=2 Tax=Xenia sp. Carnegie-2017 TaxID=2897299 RepID=UPI001F04713B|nr:uncharacterized protein LOC124445725 isoform X1 [Xenia sp. Carnegie-2017]XP_046852484.1 uncharacterized protein LOC124445767 [Xenia sp. Carnegie-2017]XP_046853345.1 uncharacterized protein LOC124446544 isoform X1 [Xenia sp. Carnegie-2017]XP_046854446.1 uncharacterized protein LOC124447529 isoform X1 [Xenia sp. Carnegie-2017]XP_046855523.1 uncharacterized protein LOC124448605 isoform X1 [Xenia sp. Carnegie-2017]XP_046864268.1 uncharacterized protein LOC124458264 isoform X1 [Xenia sp. Carnegi